ncbi:DUF5672 family protein [Mucilaginibacter sp.]
MLKKVAIVIPLYRSNLSAYEVMALQQCEHILGRHTKIAIKPKHLVLPEKAYGVNFDQVISFDDSYFSNIAGYNRLMLSAEFYARFLEYEYILIYQLDAFVFSDRLLHWCSQDIDYVGAPWLRQIGHSDMFKALKSNFKYYWHTQRNVQVNGLPSPMQFENRVGNGGFSLRRVQKFYAVASARRTEIEQYLTYTDLPQYNEDSFWSIEVNRKKNYLNIPSYKKGVWFAIEISPERAYRLTGGQLPFGCHAWDKHLSFWQPVFEQLGYQI